MTLPKIDVSRLTTDERLRLIEEVWETFVQAPETLPTSDAQRRELDRRVAEIDAGTMPSRSWDEVEAEVRRNLEKIRRRL